MNYDYSKVEKKWQDTWEKEKLYTPDVSKAKKNNKFYNLWMFPYPSAEGLHAGHAFASTGSDVYGRFMRMNGKTVFQPFGYDSFGIHSENYAIKIGENPHEVVARTTKNYERQMKSLGHGYDWTRTVTTSDTNYYRWTQWLFLKMWEKGLAYRKKAEVNFCPSCKTVLADEQVMTPKQAGKDPRDAQGQVIANSEERTEELKVCERCGTVVEKRSLDQWFFKITDYTDRLLSGLDKIDWSPRVAIAQKEWIGRSKGRIIKFQILNSKSYVEVFTTRPDTLNAVTFLATSKLYEEGSRTKVGKFTGKYAISPLDGRKIPIWDTNYVAPNYGTGVIMGVPAHDQRDREFAIKYHIDILEKEPEDNQIGKSHTNYHLRDWLVSRQRYWGAPIPMIDCTKCGWVSVPEKDLPVTLPDIKDFKPEGNGRGPLANHEEFWKVKCPKCGGEARRETDVMDTFVDSSWYFLRYPSVNKNSKSETVNPKQISNKNVSNLKRSNLDIVSSFDISISSLPWDRKISREWLPVDLYFGGAEHSVLHLMYARFVNMVLYDLRYLDHEEPFPRFFAHGLMIKDGAKMSKSRGNVVNPDIYIEKYGADTLRMYLMFMGPMDGYPDFRDSGIEGMERFLKRVWNLFMQTSSTHSSDGGRMDSSEVGVLSKLHKTIKGVTEDIKQFKYNTAIAKIMELVNVLYSVDSSLITHDSLTVLCQLLAPFAPHMTEDLWHTTLNNSISIHLSSWPKYDERYLKSDEITIVIQVNGKLRGQVTANKHSLPLRGSEQGTDKEGIIKLAKNNENISKWLEGKEIKKEIYVPNKLINFVV